MRAIVAPSSRLRDGRRRARRAGRVEDEDAVRVETAPRRAPSCQLVHPGARQTQTPTPTSTCTKLSEPLISVTLDLRRDREARRLPVADGDGVGAEAEPVDAVRQSDRAPRAGSCDRFPT